LEKDLKEIYRKAGQKGEGITFLFTDNEIKQESFLEYLNNILSTGEIGGLFARDEMEEIIQSLAMPLKKFDNKIEITSQTLTQFYKYRCRKNLHIILCFSPIGEKFRSRSLKFPALVAGCTMDW
jgi:dynein heavy chain